MENCAHLNLYEYFWRENCLEEEILKFAYCLYQMVRFQEILRNRRKQEKD